MTNFRFFDLATYHGLTIECVDVKIEPEKIKRLLIIQIRPFGDVLLNTGYLPFLRRRLPGASIDFLVKHPFQHVLDNNPHIDDCIVFGDRRAGSGWLQKLKLFAGIRSRRYDVVIDQLQGTTSAQIVLFSGAPYRIASTEVRWRGLYNIKTPYRQKRYSASMKFDLLAPLGLEEAPYQLDYFIRPESRAYVHAWLQANGLKKTPFVCISPGSPRVRKKWGAEGFAQLADLICERLQRPVVLLWGPDESGDADKVRHLMRCAAIPAPPTDFNQAAAMLEASELLICNDGGLNHLAAATRTPSLAIFGNTSPMTWDPGTVFPNHHHLYNPDPSARENSLFGITPWNAFEKARDIIEKLQQPANGGEGG